MLIKYVIIGALIGLAVGLVIPFIFPSVYETEGKIFQQFFTATNSFYGSSAKPTIPGEITVGLGALGGVIGGLVGYCISRLLRK